MAEPANPQQDEVTTEMIEGTGFDVTLENVGGHTRRMVVRHNDPPLPENEDQGASGGPRRLPFSKR